MALSKLIGTNLRTLVNTSFFACLRTVFARTSSVTVATLKRC